MLYIQRVLFIILKDKLINPGDAGVKNNIMLEPEIVTPEQEVTQENIDSLPEEEELGDEPAVAPEVDPTEGEAEPALAQEEEDGDTPTNEELPEDDEEEEEEEDEDEE